MPEEPVFPGLRVRAKTTAKSTPPRARPSPSIDHTYRGIRGGLAWRRSSLGWQIRVRLIQGRLGRAHALNLCAGPARRGRGTLGDTIATLPAALLLLSVLSGCTSFREYVSNGFKVGPNYRRPPAPVAADWIDAEDMRIRKEESPDLARWWTVFQDPVLDQLVADAYRQNITLREAGFRILQYRALLGVAVGGFFPQQQYAFGDHTANAISTQAANRSFVADQYYPQWDVGFTLNWELDFWGRFRRAIIAANERLDATVEDFDAALVTLFGDLAQAYVQIRIYEQQIA